MKGDLPPCSEPWEVERRTRLRSMTATDWAILDFLSEKPKPIRPLGPGAASVWAPGGRCLCGRHPSARFPLPQEILTQIPSGFPKREPPGPTRKPEDGIHERD